MRHVFTLILLLALSGFAQQRVPSFLTEHLLER